MLNSLQNAARAERRDKQAAHRSMKRVADWIDLESIVVVFSHLNTGGRLPAKVKQKMMEDTIVRDAVGLSDIVVEQVEIFGTGGLKGPKRILP